MNLELTSGVSLRASARRDLLTPTALIFDSGVGGLTVEAAFARVRPDARVIYLADDAMFPYGALPAPALIARVVDVVAAAMTRWSPDIVIIACNTVSTLALPALRARFRAPIVGTVPAVKPAASLSRTRRISVLGTPGTVARDYTRQLITAYAGDCAVTLVGSNRLAALAEALLAGKTPCPAEIASEIAPCFVGDPADPTARTDVVTLACTHYPWLIADLERHAPWPVTWIDPAPAIAWRASDLLGAARWAGTPAPAGAPRGEVAFTSGKPPSPALAALLAARRLLPAKDFTAPRLS